MTHFDNCALAQGFGGNATAFYASLGLLGHPGRDCHCGYGTDIHSPVTGFVYATYTPQSPASDGYTAVYILVKTKLEIFEFCIGHLSEVLVKPGDFVKKGQLIGREGNKGVVYYNGQLITLAMQKAGDRHGSHRHEQKRPVSEVAKRRDIQCLRNSKGYFKSADGMYYEHALPNNGYASCVDFSRPLFDRDLSVGMGGYDVLLLQRALGMKEKTGYYGGITELAVRKFQSANLSLVGSVTGTVGPRTRALLNSKYGQLEDPIIKEADLAARVEEAAKTLEAIQELETGQRAGPLDQLASFLKTLLTNLFK